MYLRLQGNDVKVIMCDAADATTIEDHRAPADTVLLDLSVERITTATVNPVPVVVDPPGTPSRGRRPRGGGD